jgi:hypothetical protein
MPIIHINLPESNDTTPYFLREMTRKIRQLIDWITAMLAFPFIRRKVLMPAFSLDRRPPQNFILEDEAYFKNEWHKTFEPVTKVTIPNAHLVVEEGLVIKCGHIVKESLIHEAMRNWYGWSFLKKAYSNLVELKGERYLLVHTHYGVVYGHWLADILPKLLVLRKELPHYKILLPESYVPFHLTSLAPFGLAKQDVEIIKKDSSYKIKDLTLLSHVGTSCNTKDETLQELRDFYLDFYIGKERKKPTRKLYISRSKMANRKVSNEDEVEVLLVKNDFEMIYPEEYSFEEQVRMFSDCALLVGLTGSGLTNMLFMQNGSAVVEFKMIGDYTNLHYFSMASAMQLDYYYLLCQVDGNDRLTANFRIDVSKLKEVLSNWKSQ